MKTLIFLIVVVHIVCQSFLIVQSVPLSQHCKNQCDHPVLGLGASQIVAKMTADGSTRVFPNDAGSFFQNFANCLYASAENADKYESDLIPQYGGALPECPSNCSGTFRGACVPGSGCACAPGYSGPDCSSVVCPQQTCSGNGKCVSFSGADYCRCEPGFSGIDCSDVMLPLSPVPQLTGRSQFAPGDKTLGLNNPVFDQSQIAVIRVEMSAEDLDALMDPTLKLEKDYKPGTMSFFNGGLQQTFPGIGIRTKGSASRGFMKKSFRISLNKNNPDGGDAFYGQKVLLLKATAMTPEWTRERLSGDLLYAMGVPVQRMSFAQLFINGMYRGVYQLMENIDNAFLKSRFGSSKGALWKCNYDETGSANMKYLGANCSAYAVAYQPKTALAESSCQPILELIQLVENNPPDFDDQLSAILDIDAFFSTLSAEVLSGNWDGIWNCMFIFFLLFFFFFISKKTLIHLLISF